VVKLTRNQGRTIQPKLKTFAEKEAARAEMQRAMEEFFADDGHIVEVPMGKSGVNLVKGVIK
tara:strand:+ start:313 stop:498 length:186 start_codon:yes stop_codon:yes gene_type:complete